MLLLPRTATLSLLCLGTEVVLLCFLPCHLTNRDSSAVCIRTENSLYVACSRVVFVHTSGFAQISSESCWPIALDKPVILYGSD